MKTYTPTIGIEVHAELKTKTKMFCDSLNEPHDSAPNTHVCPICMGHPGTLPVINKAAVKHVVKVGLALNSEIASYTEFDRKNYFYPDMPKGYQISQYLFPLVKGGSLNGIAITRVHLEEDTARSLHDQGDGSIVDFNRAGVPLMELVTEPVIHDSKTAGAFVRELQLLLRTIGVSDANMERGEMRVEANISVSATDTFGTKVEVKNLNSFKSMENAIDFEIKRHISAIESGEEVIQETRGWDEAKGVTFSQRKKEAANEYRYFPDPDLPKFDLTKFPELSLSRLMEEMPELPEKTREKYRNLGLTREQIELLISSKATNNFFTKSIACIGSDQAVIKLAANYLTSDIASIIKSDSELDIANPKFFSELMRMVSEGLINSRIAKDILPEVIFEGKDPLVLATDRGLLQSNSDESLLPIVLEILKNNANVVTEYKEGKESAIQFLVGQGMKVSKGAANPAVLLKLIKEHISSME